MKFTFAHNNFNVIDLDKSLKFYEEALGLKEVRRKEAADGSFILVYLGDATTGRPDGVPAGADLAARLGEGLLQPGRQ